MGKGYGVHLRPLKTELLNKNQVNYKWIKLNNILLSKVMLGYIGQDFMLDTMTPLVNVHLVMSTYHPHNSQTTEGECSYTL